MDFERVKPHVRIFLRGFGRITYGSAITWMILVSVHGFASVGGETGWIAVCDFIAACSAMVAALANMYLFGVIKKGNHK